MKKVLLGVLMSSFLLSACGSLPPPPAGDLCVINYPAGRGDCFPLSEGTKREDFYYAGIKTKLEDPPPARGPIEVPLPEMDKYVSFSPATWENVQNYIDQLIRKAQKCAK